MSMDNGYAVSQITFIYLEAVKQTDYDEWGLTTTWQHVNISTLLHRFLVG